MPKASCSTELARTKKRLKTAHVLLQECVDFARDVHKGLSKKAKEHLEKARRALERAKKLIVPTGDGE
jgi:ElaB/YqjD/DUF883 family membrane-anchored ribosome-binding protein